MFRLERDLLSEVLQRRSIRLSSGSGSKLRKCSADEVIMAHHSTRLFLTTKRTPRLSCNQRENPALRSYLHHRNAEYAADLFKRTLSLVLLRVRRAPAVNVRILFRYGDTEFAGEVTAGEFAQAAKTFKHSITTATKDSKIYDFNCAIFRLRGDICFFVLVASTALG